MEIIKIYGLILITLIICHSCKEKIDNRKFSISKFDNVYEELLNEKKIDSLTYIRGIILKKERLKEKLNGKKYSEVVNILNQEVNSEGHFKEENFENEKIIVKGIKRQINLDSIEFHYSAIIKSSQKLNQIDSIQMGISYQNLCGEQVFAELHTSKLIKDEFFAKKEHSVNDFNKFEEWKCATEKKVPKSFFTKYANFDILFVNIKKTNGEIEEIMIK